MALKLTTYYRGSTLPSLPGHNVFHSAELFHIYEQTPGYVPLLIVASEEEKICGKLLALIHHTNRSFIPKNFKQCIIYDVGEYFVDNKEEIFQEILQRITDEALRDCFFIEFRNLNDARMGYSAFRKNHYFPVNWLRVRNSLQKAGTTEFYFSTSRIRQIKKGLKNGAIVREAHTTEEIKQFAHMLHHIYSAKIRRNFPPKIFFECLEKSMYAQDLTRIFIVTYKNKIIGGSACLYSDKEAYLWFSGGMRKSYALQYPGILAVWKALDDARQRGYEHMEFMDVGLPFREHTYRNFVLRFGGRQTSTRRWFRFRWGWLNRLLIKLFV